MSAYTPKFQLTARHRCRRARPHGVGGIFRVLRREGLRSSGMPTARRFPGAGTEKLCRKPGDLSRIFTKDYICERPAGKMTVGLGVTYCSGGELEHVYHPPTRPLKTTRRALQGNGAGAGKRAGNVMQIRGGDALQRLSVCRRVLRTRSVWVQREPASPAFPAWAAPPCR